MATEGGFSLTVKQVIPAFMPDCNVLPLILGGSVRSNAFQVLVHRTIIAPPNSFANVALAVEWAHEIIKGIRKSTAEYYGFEVDRVILMHAIDGIGVHEWQLTYIPRNSELERVRIPVGKIEDPTSLALRTVVLTSGTVTISAVDPVPSVSE